MYKIIIQNNGKNRIYNSMHRPFSLSLSPACLRVHIPLSQIAEIFSTAITVEEEMCKCVENVQDEKYRSDDIHTQIRNI